MPTHMQNHSVHELKDQVYGLHLACISNYVLVFTNLSLYLIDYYLEKNSNCSWMVVQV